jgi:hypothetical protein
MGLSKPAISCQKSKYFDHIFEWVYRLDISGFQSFNIYANIAVIQSIEVESSTKKTATKGSDLVL